MKGLSSVAAGSLDDAIHEVDGVADGCWHCFVSDVVADENILIRHIGNIKMES